METSVLECQEASENRRGALLCQESQRRRAGAAVCVQTVVLSSAVASCTPPAPRVRWSRVSVWAMAVGASCYEAGRARLAASSNKKQQQQCLETPDHHSSVRLGD